MKTAEPATESPTRASPASVLPPPPPAATRPTPASAASALAQAAPLPCARPESTVMPATSTGVAPTISAAWLTLVLHDARVLQQDHGAVAQRARERDRGVERAAQPPPRQQRERERGQREAGHGQPAGAEPLQAELGERDREAPEDARAREREDRLVRPSCHGPHCGSKAPRDGC